MESVPRDRPDVAMRTQLTMVGYPGGHLDPTLPSGDQDDARVNHVAPMALSAKLTGSPRQFLRELRYGRMMLSETPGPSRLLPEVALRPSQSTGRDKTGQSNFPGSLDQHGYAPIRPRSPRPSTSRA
jgi:hypothetical protein